MVWIIVIAIIVILVVWGIGAYNSFVRSKEMVSNAMAQIATQVESRWDALTNLISAANNIKHEHDTLTKIVESRSNVRNSSVSDVEKMMRLSTVPTFN